MRRSRRLELLRSLATSGGCYVGLDDGTSSPAAEGADGGQASDAGDGGSGSGGGESGVGADCDSDGAPRIWRLSPQQYDQTVAWLFRFDAGTTWTEEFPQDPEGFYFKNNSDAMKVSSVLALQLSRAAEDIVETVFTNPTEHLAHLSPCEAADLAADAPPAECIDGFIEATGLRLFRRPLTAEEVSRYRAIVDAATTGGRGVELATEAMLQSPHFLYRTELLTQGELTSYEKVSLLALTVWDVGPDDELLALAEQGIATDDEADLVEKVLADPRAEGAYARFFVDWLDMDGVASVDKSNDPRYTPELVQAMAQEANDYIGFIMKEGDGTQASVFSSTQTIHNPALDAIYGPAVAGPDGVRQLPPTERAGLLTLPAWLALYSDPKPTPIVRGHEVRQRLFCQPMPPIPPGLPTPQVPDPVPGETERERFARHATDPVCAGCHKLMDPIGFLFSNYDALGAYITEEQGQPIDSSGSIAGTNTLDGDYANAVEMLTRVAESDELTACLPQQMYKFVYGQPVDVREDVCGLGVSSDAYAAANGDVRLLFRTMLHRRLATVL